MNWLPQVYLEQSFQACMYLGVEVLLFLVCRAQACQVCMVLEALQFPGCMVLVFRV